MSKSVGQESLTSLAHFVLGRPELLFGVTELLQDADGGRGTLQVTDELRNEDGSVSLGALGVLIDDMSGYVIAHRPGGDGGSVSLAISMYLCAPVPQSARTLSARGQIQHAGVSNATGIASITDENGTLICSGHQRAHYLPDASPEESVQGDGIDADGRVAAALSSAAAAAWAEVPEEYRTARGIAARLGISIETTAEGAVGHLAALPHLLNSRGTLHGGHSLAAVDCVATAALRDRDSLLNVNSIHLTYARAVLGGAVVRYEAEILHLGRSLAAIQVTGKVDDKPVVVGTLTAGRV